MGSREEGSLSQGRSGAGLVVGHSRSKEQCGQRLRGQGCGLWENSQCFPLVGTAGLRWDTLSLGRSSYVAGGSLMCAGCLAGGVNWDLPDLPLAILCLPQGLH